MRISTRAARALERRCWPLFLSTCRRDAAESLARGTGRAAPDRDAWEGVLRLAMRHSVAGLVLSTLDRVARLDGTTAPAILELASRLPQLRRRAALLEMQRDIVAETLREAGVEPVMLKGAALVGTLYEDAIERDFLDVDVLVPEGRLRFAVRALARVGYAGPGSWKELCTFRRHHFHVPMEMPGAPAVELHWALSRPDAHFRLSGNDVWDRAVPLACPGGPVLRVPTPEHMMLHLVLQNVQEGFTRFGRIVDIDRLVASTPAIDWSAFVSDARKGNLTYPAALSLHLAGHLLGAPVPASVLNDLRPGLPSRAHLSLLHALRPAPSGLALGESGKHLLNLWLLPTARARFLTLLALLRRAPAVPSLRPSPGKARRVLNLGKMAAVQAWATVAFPLMLATPTGRAGARLWSVNRFPTREDPTRR